MTIGRFAHMASLEVTPVEDDEHTCDLFMDGAWARVTFMDGDRLDFYDTNPNLSNQENLDRMIAKMIERRSEAYNE